MIIHRLTATDTLMVRYTRTIFPSYAEWVIIHFVIIYFTSLLLNITKVAQYIRIDHTTNINTAFSDVCVPYFSQSLLLNIILLNL